jgi:nitrogen regulatory protein P-II 1
MKVWEIKAYIHRNRIADVVDALFTEGYRNLAVIDVQGMLKALDSEEQRYSVAIGQKVVTEVKLELYCDSPSRTDEAVELIRRQARTGQASAGWMYVTEVQLAVEIAG